MIFFLILVLIKLLLLFLNKANDVFKLFINFSKDIFNTTCMINILL